MPTNNAMSSTDALTVSDLLAAVDGAMIPDESIVYLPILSFSVTEDSTTHYISSVTASYNYAGQALTASIANLTSIGTDTTTTQPISNYAVSSSDGSAVDVLSVTTGGSAETEPIVTLQASLPMLSASDIGGLQAWNVDALSASDVLLRIDGYQPTGIAIAALTVYGTVTTSSTVSTANTLLENAATGATLTNKNTDLISGTTGWVEIWSQGNATPVSGAGSEPAPSGHGWCDDTATTLAGTVFASGTWSATLQFETTTAGTFTADIHVRAYQRSSGGVYTLIAEMVNAGQTIINTSFTTFTVSANNVAESGIFAGTDHLYIDVLLNILSNTTTGNMRLEEANSSTLGTVNMRIATPGYVILTDLDALSANDVFTQADGYLPIDANTASDAINTTMLASATDALSTADSSLYTDAAIPLELLPVSDVIVSQLASSFTDAQSVSDNLAQSDGYATLEALNVSDVTNATDGAALVDAGSASDIGNMQGWNVDALTASDALTGTDTGNFTDSSAASDSLAQTENYQASDTQSVDDSFVQSGVYQASDVQSVVDALLGIDGSLYVELLTVSDEQGQVGPVTTEYDFTDSLSSTDLFVGSGVLIILDGNVSSDSLAQAAQYMASDAQTVSDNLAQSGSYLVSDVQNVADLFASAGILITFDSAATSDVFAQAAQYMALDTQAISDSIAFLYIFPAIEANNVSDALLSTDGIAWLDQATISDAFTSAANLVGADALSITDSFAVVVALAPTEQLAAIDALLATDSVLTWIDTVPISDLFSMVEAISIEQTPAVVVALGRSGEVVAIGRNGKVAAVGRSGKASAQGR